MKQTFDYWMIVTAYLLQYVYVGVVLWELWLALPFVSGYNWHSSLKYVGIAFLMYLSGCFMGGECEKLQTIYLTKYREEQEDE